MKKMIVFLALEALTFGQLPGPFVQVACTPQVHGMNIPNPVCYQQAAVAPALPTPSAAPKSHAHRVAAPVATTRTSVPQVSPAEIEAAAARGTARGMAEGIVALKAAFPAPATAPESAPAGVDENRVRTIAREEADKSVSAVLDLAAAADRKANEALSQARRGSALAEQLRAIMAERGTRGEKKAARKINGVIQTPSQ